MCYRRPAMSLLNRLAAPQRRPALEAVGVTLLVTVGLIVSHHSRAPSWYPSGSDWDQWYSSALALSREVHYPETRWPLYGMLAALLDLLVPGPLHRDATLLSLLATGGAAGGLYRIGRGWIGPIASAVAVVLSVSHPFVREHASWIGAYSLWACLAVGGALALRAAAQGANGYIWLGLMIGANFAVMEKGLLLGGVLGALAILLFLTESRRPADLARMAVPFGLLALVYALFPYPLASLDTIAALPVGQIAPPTPGGGPPVDLTGEGYVFGKAMGPSTLWSTFTTLSQGRELGTGASAETVLGRLADAMPGVHLVGVGYGLAVGAFAGLIAVARRSWQRARGTLLPGSAEAADVWGLLGLIGVLVAAAPAFRTSIEIRFLAPALVVAPLVALLPLTFLPVWGRALAPLLLPLCLVSASPWSGSPWLCYPGKRQGADDGERFAAKLWFELKQDLPDAIIDVSAPRAGGLLLIDSHGGRVFEAPDLRGETLDPGHYLLLWLPNTRGELVGRTAEGLNLSSQPGAPSPGSSEEAVDLSGRAVLRQWRHPVNPGLVVLVSPVSA